MPKLKSRKIKLNPLERWQKAGALCTAIQNALPPELKHMTFEEVFSGEHDAELTPEIKAMHDLKQQLRANNYGQA